MPQQYSLTEDCSSKKSAEDRFDHSLVCQIAFYETEIFKLLQFVQTCFLQAHIIIVVHVVQTHNLDTLHRGEQTLCKVGTNETRYTRDKNAFVFQINFCFMNCIPLIIIRHCPSVSSLSGTLKDMGCSAAHGVIAIDFRSFLCKTQILHVAESVLK